MFDQNPLGALEAISAAQCDAVAFSVQHTSLYFSCVANGTSQMYDSTVFLSLAERAGPEIGALIDGVGRYHTLLECHAAA